MKARTLLSIFALACLVLAAAVWLGPVYRANRATRESIEALQSTLAQQSRELEDLNRELRALRTDYRAIERVARERFGMCRPGEEIYHFEPSAEAAVPAGTDPAAGAPARPAAAP